MVSFVAGGRFPIVRRLARGIVGDFAIDRSDQLCGLLAQCAAVRIIGEWRQQGSRRVLVTIRETQPRDAHAQPAILRSEVEGAIQALLREFGRRQACLREAIEVQDQRFRIVGVEAGFAAAMILRIPPQVSVRVSPAAFATAILDIAL